MEVIKKLHLYTLTVLDGKNMISDKEKELHFLFFWPRIILLLSQIKIPSPYLNVITVQRYEAISQTLPSITNQIY